MPQENKKDYTLPAGKAWLQALPIMFLFLFFYISIFYLVRGIAGLKPGFKLFMQYTNFIPIFVGGIILHEFLHGITWKIFAKIPLKKIIFGFRSKSITPYAHCSVPVKMYVYKIGLIAPALILGIIPAIIAIAYNNTWLLYFGILFSIVDSIDLLVLWNIYDIKNDRMVQDHPMKAGCILVE